MKRVSLFAAALMFVAGSSMAQPVVLYETGFETDQSSTFTIQSADGDYTANFTYDYSTHTQSDGTGFTIPKSPNSDVSDGTLALRVEVNNNDATAATTAMNLFPNVPVGSDYIVQFDFWLNHTGDAGGSGTTEAISFGAASSTTDVYSTIPLGTDGFIIAIDNDGDSSFDYRYAEGGNATALATSHSTPNWWGTDAQDNGATEWQSFFPEDEVYQTAGAAAKRWVTVTMEVSSSTVIVSLQKASDGSATQVASFATGAGNPDNVFIGYEDFFSSIATTASDAFGLIDNLVISEPGPPPTAAEKWTLYN